MDAQLEQHIRERAFLLWENSSVKGGSDIDYWVAAESEVKATLVVKADDAASAKPKRARSTKASAPKAKSSAAKFKA